MSIPNFNDVMSAVEAKLGAGDTADGMETVDQEDFTQDFDKIDDLYKEDKSEQSQESTEENITSDKSTEQTQKDPNKKTFTITDEFGEERQITIDASDDGIKGLIKKAKASDELKLEFDAMRDKMASYEKKIKEMEETYKKAKELESLSPEDFLDKKYAKEGGYTEWLKKQHDEIKKGMTATEEELEEMQRNKERSAFEREKQDIAKKLDNALNELKKQKEEAAQATLNSWVESATSKYSFTNIVKDPKEAEELDDYVWARAQRSLSAVQNSKVELTPAIINAEVQKAHMALRKKIRAQADKDASNAIQNQKDKAANSAANSFKAGQASSDLETEVKNLLAKGNESAILKMARKNPRVLGILRKLQWG